ncbi:MAG: hypothetical protein HOP28_02930 [Gemmatimonadales bacterium]|nr:hypothetical protein [Gemmatimonadales bacterium]
MTHPPIALLLRTLRLQGGLTDREAAAEWARVDIHGLERLLAFEGAALWLYRRLQALGAASAPAGAEALRALAHGIAMANMRADEEAAAVLALLGRAGIPVALIKGQARRAAAERYPFANARAVADVDLLVPDDAADRGFELLVAEGYEPSFGWASPWKVEHHRPALWNHRRVAVELHTTTGDTVPPAEAWRRATALADGVTWNGAPHRVPNATELVWQAAAHALGDGTKGYTLKAFLNAAAVLARAPEIRWDTIRERIDAGEVVDLRSRRRVPKARLWSWLRTAQDLAGGPLPGILAGAVPFPLERHLVWRAAVLNRGFGERVRERLLEEGARTEARMSLSPAVAGSGPMQRLRRRGSSLAARLLYNGWLAWR